MEKLGVGIQEFLQSVQVLLGSDVRVLVNGGLVQAESPLPSKPC